MKALESETSEEHGSLSIVSHLKYACRVEDAKGLVSPINFIAQDAFSAVHMSPLAILN